MNNDQTPPTTPLALITVEDLYAALAAAGMFSAQIEEPNLDEIADRAHRFGRKMAAKHRSRNRAR